ncbi:MAG: tRNA pseudouridine(55) synthase TruB [Cyanobacteria bacterium SIG31]|nr:tRNA pseudouridine(55) synthase TruB [Cyanobacteria bacterium SIG31]
MFGFLNIYKPKGKTSHDVVAILRRITKVKQIGHTGTLDPFAEGVLPICIGKATRLIEYLDDEKAYIGTVQFGESTTTYDIEGDSVNTSKKRICLKDLKEKLSLFKGEIEQNPPIYSAIKVKGKKLYEYARAGEDVEIKPRRVNIQRLEVISFDEEKQTAELIIECSKGTYIRSIANDLGEALGCYGHLIKLVRIKAGKFEIQESIRLEDLEEVEQVKSNIIYPICYLNYPKYELKDFEKEKISHGMAIEINNPDGIIMLTKENLLIAVARLDNGKAKPLKVFI